LLAVLCAVAFAQEAAGASFDCAKAKTEIETTICSDAELSKADDELARVYSETLKRAKAADRKQLQEEQRKWLKLRDVCASRLCLVSSYRRQTAALNEYGLSPSQRSWAREWPRIAPESKKLEIIKKVIRERKFTPSLGPADPPYCRQAFQDLVSGEHFVAVEPEVRAESQDDPRLTKWHRCNRAEEDDVKNQAFPYLGIEWAGGPPYRSYRVEVDGNPDNGPEDVLYTERGLSNRTGYTWVDIEGCTVKRTVNLMVIHFPEPPPPGHYKLNVLANYRGEAIVIELAALHANPDDSNEWEYGLGVERINGKQAASCHWWTRSE
jgi:uncharacterized protein YecT (DUF1311 family)